MRWSARSARDRRRAMLPTSVAATAAAALFAGAAVALEALTRRDRGPGAKPEDARRPRPAWATWAARCAAGPPTLRQFSRPHGASQSRRPRSVIGRDAEIERVVSILARRSKNNPVLVGEPGVGKTAIVEESRPAHRAR